LRIRMHLRERNPALQQRIDPLPRPFAALTATIQNLRHRLYSRCRKALS
jgi:hypothetical protein